MKKAAGFLSGMMIFFMAGAGTAFGAPAAYAETPKTAEQAAEALAAQSDLFYVSGDKLRAKGTYNDNFWDELDYAINAVFRSCDGSEMDSLTATYNTASPEILSYQIREEQLQILADNQTLVNNWLADNVPAIIPNGTNKEDAIWLAYTHVVNSYAPDYTALADTGYMRKEAQGAAYVIKNGKGICAGLTKLFRSIAEYIPFDPQTGQVNYSAANPEYLQVAIVKNDEVSHEWAAISLGGVWYHYDLSIINTANLGERYRMEAGRLNAADYGNSADMVWRY